MLQPSKTEWISPTSKRKILDKTKTRQDKEKDKDKDKNKDKDQDKTEISIAFDKQNKSSTIQVFQTKDIVVARQQSRRKENVDIDEDVDQIFSMYVEQELMKMEQEKEELRKEMELLKNIQIQEEILRSERMRSLEKIKTQKKLF